jgi:hypothetical protein
MCKESNNKGSLRSFARRQLFVFKASGKSLLAPVLLVFTAQPLLIGCGSTVYKTDKDAEDKAGEVAIFRVGATGGISKIDTHG